MTTPMSQTATYAPAIVWGTGTGVDTSAYDDVSASTFATPGLVVDGIGRDAIRSYRPPKAPSGSLLLTNHDGRFSPGGPLNHFLGRGPAVRFDAAFGVDVLGDAADVLGDDRYTLGDGLATQRLFTGTSQTMEQQIGIGQYTVAVTAVGALATLISTSPTTAVYENIRTDEAVTVLLDAAGWPADRRSIDAGDTTLLYWWLDGQTNALDALNVILTAEGPGSCAWEGGDGTFHFEGRQFRDNNPRSLAPQWAFFDTRLSGNAIGDSTTTLGDDTTTLGDGAVDYALLYVAPAQYSSNPDEVVDSVALTVNTRAPSAPEKVWEYGGPLVLASAQVIVVHVTATEPFKDAITPRDGTDYTIASGGPLTDVTLLQTSGQTVMLRLTAPVGGCTIVGVVSDGIQVRASRLPIVSSQTITSTVNIAQATARQGWPNKPLVLQAWPEIEPTQALDLVNSMALRYQRERRQITFQVVNLDGIHQYAMLNLRPSDRIQFVHTHAALSMQLWVETLRYEVGAEGLMRLTIGAEQVFDLSGGRFDAATFGIDVFGI